MNVAEFLRAERSEKACPAMRDNLKGSTGRELATPATFYGHNKARHLA